MNVSAMDFDLRVRLKAFEWLGNASNRYGETLPRRLLEIGFDFEDIRIPLVGPQGIFKPHGNDYPLSITTIPDSHYDDKLSDGDFIYYKYRGTDPQHWENVGLRRLFEKNRPLIYFYRVVIGQYVASWPAYIIADDPARLTFTVAIEETDTFYSGQSVQHSSLESSNARQAYITMQVKVRLQQQTFRERVLKAYQSKCAFCHLRHRELLDAAHIIPDSEPAGTPTIPNGLALCKLHHAAFDRFLIGVTSDYTILVRQDILDEDDGPILQHGLQELHNTGLVLPHDRKDWPLPANLAWRFDQFLQHANP